MYYDSWLATDFEYCAYVCIYICIQQEQFGKQSGSQQWVWQSKAYYFSLPENTSLLEKLNFKAVSETQFQGNMTKMEVSWR